jgi:hypothetical protein
MLVLFIIIKVTFISYKVLFIVLVQFLILYNLKVSLYKSFYFLAFINMFIVLNYLITS